MKVCPEWNEKERDIHDKENITSRLINQHWNEKDINLHSSLIIINLNLWLVMTVKLNNMPPIP